MRLVTYSWLAVILAIACAAVGWVGLPGWIALAVLFASIAMHVAGNWLGTSLRDATDRHLTFRRDVSPERRALPTAPPSALQRRASLGRLVPVSAGIGAACGGTAGGLALAYGVGSSLAGAALGGISSAVVGGLLGFLAASFVEIIRESLRESLAAERRSPETTVR